MIKCLCKNITELDVKELMKEKGYDYLTAFNYLYEKNKEESCGKCGDNPEK